MRAFWLILFFAVSGLAQPPDPELRLGVGWTGFLDDASDDHIVVRGSGRFYVTARMGIELEAMYLKGDDHHDLTVAPNITFDFGRRGPVVPYVLCGFGWMRSSFSRFTTDDIFLNGGVGAKFFLTDRLYVAPEVRAGWEPHLSFTAGFGLLF